MRTVRTVRPFAKDPKIEVMLHMHESMQHVHMYTGHWATTISSSRSYRYSAVIALQSREELRTLLYDLLLCFASETICEE